MSTTGPVTTAHPAMQQVPAPASAVGTAATGSGGVATPIVQPSEVVSRKPVQIALDTSGVSQASVRQNAQPLERAVQEAANSIQQFIQSRGVQLNISYDHQTGFNVVQVIDPNTGEMVMQLPSQEAVNIAHAMDSLQGLLVNKFA